MKNSFKRLSITTLLSTALCSLSIVKTYATQNLFETDEDIQLTIDSGLKKVVSLKNSQLAQRHKLSDKGDLDPETWNEPLRREFYMLGDGNCAWWSMGTDYATAINLLLNNSNNSTVRTIAHQEIVDEFANLPQQIKNREDYQNLQNSLNEIDMLLESGVATVGHEDYIPDAREDLLAQKDLVEQRIATWAKREDVFRDYITYALINGHYMGFRGDQGTYFIDAVAHLMNKNLKIWIQYDRNTLDLITGHPGDEDHPIKIAHTYNKGGADGTLEIIHRGNHFNRLVRVNDNVGLQQAIQDEKTALENLGKMLEKSSLQKIDNDFSFLDFQIYNAILNGNDFSNEEKEDVQPLYDHLKKQGIQDHKVSPKILKAYCLASLEAFEKYKKELIEKAQKDPEQVKQNFINQRLPQNSPLRNNQNFVNNIQRQANALAQTAEKEKQEAQKELGLIAKKTDLFEKMSNAIKLNVSESDIFETLNKIISSLSDRNESLRSVKEELEKASLLEDAEDVEAQYNKSTALKGLYEEIHRKYQEKYLKDLNRKLKSGVKQTQGKVDGYLKSNPAIHGINLKTDFNNAKSKLEEITNQFKQQQKAYVNPLTILYDPFLSSHNQDIHIEYPNNIDDNEYFNDILGTVKDAIIKVLISPDDREGDYKNKNFGDNFNRVSIRNFSNLRLNHAIFQNKNLVNNPLGILTDDWLYAFNNIESVFSKAVGNSEGGNTLRKRIKRLLDASLRNTQALLEEDADPIEEALKTTASFGILMAQNVGRCIDGVSNGVESFEGQIVYGNAGAEVALEQKVSKLLVTDRHNFILENKVIGQGAEERTAVPEGLLQRMRSAMSLRGNTRELAYPGYARLNDDRLDPANVMARYLVQDQNFQSIKARTPDYLTDLLFDAYMKHVNNVKGQGEVITLGEVSAFAGEDTTLKPMLGDISDRIIEGEEGISNAYFEERDGRVGVKKAFFRYLLERLGYIVNPNTPNMNPFDDKSSDEESTIDTSKMRYAPLQENELRTLQQLFDQKKNGGALKYQGFNKVDESHILKIAGTLVAQQKAISNEDGLEKAIDELWRKRYEKKLSTLLQNKKGEDLYKSLSPSTEKAIVKRAAQLVESGNYTFEKALASAATSLQYKLPEHLKNKEAYNKWYIEKALLPEIRKIVEHPAFDNYDNFVKTSWTGYTVGMDLNQYWQTVWASKANCAPEKYELPEHLLTKEEFDKNYIETVLLPEIRKIDTHPAYNNYESFVKTSWTGYTVGMDLNRYWQTVWASKTNAVPKKYELPIHLITKEEFDRNYIETVLLPEIRKIDTHPAYNNYESFVKTSWTGYTVGMDLNEYWQTVWASKTEAKPKKYELPEYLISQEEFDKKYIEKFLLPEIRKIVEHPAFDNYESFVKTSWTGYTVGMDLNEYWQTVWASKTEAKPKKYELPEHLLSKEEFDKKYIEKVLLPEIRKIVEHPAFDNYDKFIETSWTGYTIGMDLNDYWKNVWASKTNVSIQKYELPKYLLKK
jgi:hypothetical protein